MLPTRAQRGLLIGLLALIAFASSAVAITARGAGATGAAAPATISTDDTAARGDAEPRDADGDGARRIVLAEHRGHHR